jgi:hypothetical protein
MVGETFSAAYSATIAGASTGVIELPHHWYAIRTRSCHEKIVADQLTSRGMETFLPVVRRSHQSTDRTKEVELPAFAGYSFVRMVFSLAHRPGVLETHWVVGFVGHEECRLADSGWSDSGYSNPSCERPGIRRARLSTGRAAGENSRRVSGWDRGHSVLARPRSEPGRFPRFDPEIAVGSNSRISIRASVKHPRANQDVGTEIVQTG